MKKPMEPLKTAVDVAVFLLTGTESALGKLRPPDVVYPTAEEFRIAGAVMVPLAMIEGDDRAKVFDVMFETAKKGSDDTGLCEALVTGFQKLGLVDALFERIRAVKPAGRKQYAGLLEALKEAEVEVPEDLTKEHDKKPAKKSAKKSGKGKK